MFSLTAKGWQYLDPANNEWVNTGSKSFNDKLNKRSGCFATFDKQDSNEFLPVFSGTKILCVGRNYRKHAAELNNEVPERPLWFSKPPSSIIGTDQSVILPKDAGRIDYEGELALIISKKCSKVSEADALNYVGAVSVAFDITARELQKSDGQWTRAKGFDTFLPLASIAAPFTPQWQNSEIEVQLNGKTVQKSSLEAMIFKFECLIADISACMTLEPGDLILTGTPEGVGPIEPGDELIATISGPCKITLNVDVKED
ncbi:MAG: fumarylacetoacetate hydrolase family protein [Candidatus Rifleibacteriota bacterium]